MASPDAPLQVPQLRSYSQAFTRTDSIHILGTDHGLGPVTLRTLIVQVFAPEEEGGLSGLLDPSTWEYVLDEGSQDVLVTLRQPMTGSVLLTVLGPLVPVELEALAVMPPVPPEETPAELLPSETPPGETPAPETPEELPTEEPSP